MIYEQNGADKLSIVKINNTPVYGITKFSVLEQTQTHDIWEYLSNTPSATVTGPTKYIFELEITGEFAIQGLQTDFEFFYSHNGKSATIKYCNISEISTVINKDGVKSKRIKLYSYNRGYC
ncbi:MAG: hypothetical protein LBM65_02005 [Oscillospiraceae bacterium]|nr:hypothetical protein [Oscillospiraceae bacterium]